MCGYKENRFHDPLKPRLKLSLLMRFCCHPPMTRLRLWTMKMILQEGALAAPHSSLWNETFQTYFLYSRLSVVEITPHYLSSQLCSCGKESIIRIHITPTSHHLIYAPTNLSIYSMHTTPANYRPASKRLMLIARVEETR